MKKELLLLFSIYIIAIPLFWIGNYLTPSTSLASGNGNPAFVVMFIVFILFLIMVYCWMKIFIHYPIKRSISLLGIVLILAHLTLAFLHQRKSALEFKEIFAERYEEFFGYVDWTYVDQATSLFSIHLNAQFFNLNTYFMYITAAIMLSLILSFVPQIKRLKFLN